MFDYMGLPSHWSTIKKLIWLKASALASAVYQTVTGAIATFTTLRAAPLKSLSVALDLVQSGTGDPSPDNVRPITGWTEVKVWVQPTHDTTADPTVTVDLDGTRYGGTLDVLTGVLTVDKATKTISISSANTVPVATNTSGKYRWRTTVDLSDCEMPTATARLCGALFDKGIEISADATYARNGEGFSVRNDTTLIYYSDAASEMSLAEYFAYIGGSVQIVYPLATPVTYQLTPQEITTMLGNNCVWADTGDVTVTYRSN